MVLAVAGKDAITFWMWLAISSPLCRSPLCRSPCRYSRVSAINVKIGCCPPAAAGGGAGRRRGLHNTPTATPFLPVQHPLTALPEPGRTTSYLGHPAYFFYALHRNIFVSSVTHFIVCPPCQ